MINLNKKDSQGVVPLCLLVMNMTPIEKKLKESKALSPVDEFAKSAANFFFIDNSQEK